MSSVTFARPAYPRLHDSVVTQSGLQAELHPIRIDIAVLKWMLGAVLAGVVSLVLKGSFGHG